jgi:hypothetical protein
MVGQLIGPSSTGAAGFPDEFTPNDSNSPKPSIHHGRLSPMVVMIYTRRQTIGDSRRVEPIIA